MKVSNENTAAEKFGVFETTEFTIKTSPKAFEILSSGLYQDKISAILRELGCNAYDSHVEAGCPEVPFDVKLPNYIDNTFKIRDYGTGLSKKDVLHLYTTYFQSTKTNSNDYVGAFGLGSKTPLCYTDSFIVVSYFNGMKMTFSVFLDEGLPKCSFMHEEETDEPNGLEISFNCKTADFYEFEKSSAKIYRWFKTIPNITGTQYEWDFNNYVEKLDPLLKHDYWTVYRPNSKIGLCILQGNVLYPVQYIDAFEEFQKMFWKINMVIEVPIGTIDVTASREQIDYNKKTKNQILDLLKKVITEINDKIEESINNQRSPLDAVKFLLDIQKCALRSKYVTSIFDVMYHSLSLMDYVNRRIPSDVYHTSSDIRVISDLLKTNLKIDKIIIDNHGRCKQKISKYCKDTNIQALVVQVKNSTIRKCLDLIRSDLGIYFDYDDLVFGTQIARMYLNTSKKPRTKLEDKEFKLTCIDCSDPTEITKGFRCIKVKVSDIHPTDDLIAIQKHNTLYINSIPMKNSIHDFVKLITSGIHPSLNFKGKIWVVSSSVYSTIKRIPHKTVDDFVKNILDDESVWESIENLYNSNLCHINLSYTGNLIFSMIQDHLPTDHELSCISFGNDKFPYQFTMKLFGKWISTEKAEPISKKYKWLFVLLSSVKYLDTSIKEEIAANLATAIRS